MTNSVVHYELDGRTAVIRLDDGRANSLSPDSLKALNAALDRAEKDAAAVVLLGREGRFSGGFDLDTLRKGPEATYSLVTAGAELMLRLAELPLPVVTGCTGHAIAAGALLLLASDLRLGAKGEFKIGLNEVAIGMTLPNFAVELARERLSKRHYNRATNQAELYRPETAVDAGFLDMLCEPEALASSAQAEAARLTELAQPAFRNTKQRNARGMLERIRAALETDVRGLTGT